MASCQVRLRDALLSEMAVNVICPEASFTGWNEKVRLSLNYRPVQRVRGRAETAASGMSHFNGAYCRQPSEANFLERVHGLSIGAHHVNHPTVDKGSPSVRQHFKFLRHALEVSELLYFAARYIAHRKYVVIEIST